MSCNGMSTFAPANDSAAKSRSVSPRVSGSRLMSTLLPCTTVKPIDSGASVPISTWPPRMGSSTCITRFLSASDQRGLARRGGGFAEAMDGAVELAAEDGAVEGEGLFGGAGEVEVDADSGHVTALVDWVTEPLPKHSYELVLRLPGVPQRK